MHNFLSTFNALPPSASLAVDPGGKKRTVCGFSFLVKIVPYLEHDDLYKNLPQGADPEDTTNQAIAMLMKTRINEFRCPSAARIKPARLCCGASISGSHQL